tara:strand:+ start:251 stop:562 length:312 start_codon:yes stop_codon:yes gene_type:complete
MAYKMKPKSPLLQDMPQFNTRYKQRGGKTIIKTKGEDGYKSKIVLNEDGDVTKAKNTETKNKNKKDPRRTKRAKWIDRDLAGYKGIQNQMREQRDKFYRSYGL